MPETPLSDAGPLHVGILLFRGFEPLDAIGPAQVFWALQSVRPFLDPFRELVVHLVAETADPVVAAYGFTVHPTVSYADCPPLDVLVVAGGSGDTDSSGPATGRRFYATYEPTLDFVRRQATHTQVTASVCTGSFVLAGAGLLEGHRATTHWTARDELVELMAARGETFEIGLERVVDEGDIVTAGGVSSGIELGFHLVERLFGREVRNAVELAIEIETPAGAPF